MNNKYEHYTYRAGKKVRLRKSDNELVVRQKTEALPAEDAFKQYKQVSSASTRIRTDPGQLEQIMSRARTEAPTHHAYYEEDGDTAFLISDRIFGTFHNAPSNEELSAFTAKYALILLKRYSDRDFLFQLTTQTGINPVKLVVQLSEHDDSIEYAEHDLNHQVTTYQVPVPTDPEYYRHWHLHTNFNDVDYDQRACSMCEEAWHLLDGFGSDAVTIAISDDGCRLDHTDFDSPDKFAGWGYFQGQRLVTADDFDAVPQQMYKQGANHGTSCAGVAAGEVDASRIVGAAPGCKLLPVMFESNGPSLFISSSRMLTTLDYIANRADIMSNSWGNVPINVWPTLVVNRIAQLAQNGGLRGKGILFLWAAGNENCPINLQTTQDVPYTSGVDVQGNSLVWVGVQTARNFENNLVGIQGVMHIAACASNARRSHYSNYGPGIALISPSSNSHEYNRMVVRGLGVTTSTGSAVGVTNSFGGTSSSTPLVAGVAALTLSAYPELRAVELAGILKQTASKDMDFLPYGKTPPAPFDADPSWDVSPIAPFDNGAFGNAASSDGTWSPWFGHGRVDARRAVAEALSRATVAGPTHFSAASAPNVSIPDNNAGGVVDVINCSKDFRIDAVKTRVDATHTYSGDLRISLASPSGMLVTLHDRTGGSSHDIHVDFDVQNTPELHQFAGVNALGQWSLLVQDLAAMDVGRLQSWSLQLRGAEADDVVVGESPGLIIPDNQLTGLQRTVHVAANVSISAIGVHLDITHTYISDLKVSLTAPDGMTAILHDRSGGSRDNIIADFTNANTPALQALVGHGAMGDWQLNVTDHADQDQGKLNHWQLTIA